MIRIPQVRVVDEEGSQLGVMPTAQALALAQERGYDLVEVAPMAAPPVVRFLDFGQFKYEATKREKEAKRKQRSVTFKEVRLKPKIATGDFDTRVRRAIQFLEEGDRLKVAVQFRGRELTHPEIGRNLLARFSERIKDHGVVERAPLLEGKSMHITVASIHKPKVIEAPKHDEAASAGADGASTAPADARQLPTASTSRGRGTGRGRASRPSRRHRQPSRWQHRAKPLAEAAAAEAPAEAAAPVERLPPRPPRSRRRPSRHRLEPGRRRQPAHRLPERRPQPSPNLPHRERQPNGRRERPAQQSPRRKATVASTGKTAAKPAATTGE